MRCPGAERGRYARLLAGGYDVVITGGTGFRLRDSRSGHVIGEFADTRDVFIATLAEVANGIPSRALRMDVRIPTGEYELETGGDTLVHLAQSALGAPNEQPKRVAEG